MKIFIHSRPNSLGRTKRTSSYEDRDYLRSRTKYHGPLSLYSNADLASPSPLAHMNDSLQNPKQLPTSAVVGVAFLKHILK